MNAVEFSNDVAQAECCQVLQAAPLPIQEAVIAQDPFDGPFVKFEMEVLENLFADSRARQIRLGSLVDDVADEIRGEFIGFCLAPRFVDQAWQTLFAKSLQGPVEGFPRIAELPADPGDEAPLMAMGAQHLVFNLTPILRLKEIGALKQIRLDAFFGMSHGIPIFYSHNDIP